MHAKLNVFEQADLYVDVRPLKDIRKKVARTNKHTTHTALSPMQLPEMDGRCGKEGGGAAADLPMCVPR